MPVLNTPRAGRNQEGYLEKLIVNMHMDNRVICKAGYGVCDISPESIIDSFNFVRNQYQKMSFIKVHYIEIFIEYEFDADTALGIADLMGRYLYNQGFQSFTSTIDTGNSYMVAVAVNAVSFVDGRAFHDNNMQYAEIYNMLRQNMPVDWNLSVTNNTLFSLEDGTENYMHGQYA